MLPVTVYAGPPATLRPAAVSAICVVLNPPLFSGLHGVVDEIELLVAREANDASW